MTSTTTTGRFASYFDGLALGEPVDLEALLGFHRARFGDSAMEDTGGDDQTGKDDAGKDDDKGKDDAAGGDGGGKDDDSDDDPPDLGEAGKRALRKERDARKAAEKAAEKDRTELERLRTATQTDQEKALAAEKAEGAAEARKQLQPDMVRAQFKVAAAGRLDADRLEDLTEDIDLSRFLTEDGKVDVKKVAKKVDTWAPKKDERPGSRRDPSQGARGGEAKGGDGGRAEAARRWPKK